MVPNIHAWADVTTSHLNGGVLRYLKKYIQLFRETLSEKSTKLHKPIPKDSMGRRIELLHVLNTNEI